MNLYIIFQIIFMVIINLFAITDNYIGNIITFINYRTIFNMFAYIYGIVLFVNIIIFSVIYSRNNKLENERYNVINTYLNMFSILFLISSLIVNTETYMITLEYKFLYFYYNEIINPIYIITVFNIIFIILLIINKKKIIIDKYILIFITELTLTLLVNKLGDINYP